MAETLEFKVKDQSVTDFFLKYCPSFKLNQQQRNGDGSVYYLFKDEIILSRQALEILPQKQVVIELADRARYSDRELINVYTYRIEPYDIVSVKLVLVDFNVKLKDEGTI